MDYLLFKLWPYLLLVFLVGIAMGYATCPGSRQDDDR